MKSHYVDNVRFYEELKAYRETEGTPDRKPASDYIGSCILLICQRLSTSSMFWQYSFSEEMVSDALIDCIEALDNFDYKRFNNPHAYFTQIAMYAFFRRIELEKKAAYIKAKSLDNALLDGEEIGIDNSEMKRTTMELTARYERKRSVRRGKKRKRVYRRIG